MGGWAGGVMPAPRPPFRAALLAQAHLATWNMRIMRMRVNSVRDGITSVTSCRPAWVCARADRLCAHKQHIHQS